MMRIFREIHRRTSIKTKGVLYVMLLIVVIYISVSILILSSARRNLLVQRQQFHRSVAEKLAINASDAIISDDYGFLMEQIRQLRSSGQIKDARIIDRRGIVIASDRLENIGRFGGSLHERLQSSSSDKPNKPDPSKCDIFMLVEIDGDVLGALELNFDTVAENIVLEKDFKRTIIRLVYLAFIIFAAGIGGSYVVSLLMTRSITNLSKEIEAFEKEIAPGSKSLSDPSHNDEAVQLRHAFYHMRENLRKYLADFRRMSEEKEKLTCMAAIGQVSAQIAHEIRNSLYAIRGAISGVERSNDLPEIREYMDIMKDETLEMTIMTDKFLRFAKVPAPSPVSCNIDDVVTRVTELLEPDLEESHVNVIGKVDVNIPAIMGDPALLKQVFMNLFINAIQAMKEGGEITVEYALSDGWIEVYIKDTGPGISEEIASMIFQPFFTTKADGSGLGLAMVYKIVLAHHGDIQLLKSDMGAHFLIRLPLTDNVDVFNKSGELQSLPNG